MRYENSPEVIKDDGVGDAASSICTGFFLSFHVFIVIIKFPAHADQSPPPHLILHTDVWFRRIFFRSVAHACPWVAPEQPNSE